jgi:uncharacterized protein involved in outer membrane biogenesis
MPDNETAWARRSSLLRKLLILGGAIFVLVFAAYFVLTSGAFFKGFILPKVAASMNSEVTVAEASISPFSQVVLRDLKVTPRGAETLLTVAEVRLRYRLLGLLGGKLAVEELALDTPTINLVQNADGTNNLHPLLQAFTPVGGASSSKSASAKPMQIDLQRISLSHASVKQTVKFKGGGQQVVELANGNLTLTDFKNGQTGKLDFDADLRCTTTMPTNGSLVAKLTSHFTVNLGPDALPKTVNGALQCLVQQAAGSLVDLQACSAAGESDMTPTEVKEVVLKFKSGTNDLGQARLSGPLDLAKQEGKLKLEIYGLDRRVLNLAAQGQGMDFGATAFTSTNQIEMSAGGKIIALSGQFLGASVSVARPGLATPALDLVAAYDLTVDQNQQAAWLRSFKVNVTRDRKPLVNGVLSKPMKLDWRTGSSAVEESELTLALTGLDMRDYRALVGTNVLGGVINAALGIQAKAAGRQTFITLTADGAGLAAVAGSNTVSEMGFTLRGSATLNDFQRLQIDKTDFKWLQRGTEIARAQLSGNVELQKQNAALAINASASLPALTALAPSPGLALTGGSLAFDATFKQDNLTLPNSPTASFARSLEGKLRLSGLSGVSSGLRFNGFDTAAAFDVVLKNDLTTLRKLTGTLKQAGQPAGAYDGQAEYDGATQATTFAFQLAGLNENALRPFLTNALGDKSFTSVAINAGLNGSYNPAADSTIKGDLSMTNFVVKDPSGKLPTTPLEAQCKLDLGLRQQVATFRDCALMLTPTARAKNSVQLTGTVDFTDTNAVTGSLKLLAESLDFTSYYDRFTGGSSTATNSVVKPAPTAPAVDPNQEPAVIPLPFRNFTVEANVSRCYLREVDITNFQTTLKLDAGHVSIKPFQLTFNGAPVTAEADLNLGVPGYTYDVSFSATNGLPLPPLVDSFMPERKGQFAGSAIASGHIKGKGITGAGLQKNLSGEFGLAATNLNFSLDNARSTLLKSVVNVIISIPDYIRNPTAAVGSLLGKLTGSASPSGAGGWVDQILKSPLNAIVLRGNMGGGQVKLAEATIQSSAFLAQAGGGLALNPVLTNSTLEIPLHISLARSLAEKVKLVPDGTPTNAVFAKLPDFVTMKGTVGEPKADINYRALAGLALKSSGGVLLNTGNATVDKVGGLLGTAAGLIGGGTPALTATNPPAQTNSTGSSNLVGTIGSLFGSLVKSNATNLPAQTNSPGSSNLVGTLGNLLGGLVAPATTNAPAATTTNAPASPVQGILDLFNKPKKP